MISRRRIPVDCPLRQHESFLRLAGFEREGSCAAERIRIGDRAAGIGALEGGCPLEIAGLAVKNRQSVGDNSVSAVKLLRRLRVRVLGLEVGDRRGIVLVPEPGIRIVDRAGRAVPGVGSLFGLGREHGAGR